MLKSYPLKIFWILSLLFTVAANADSGFVPRQFSDFATALGGSIPFPPENFVKQTLALDKDSRLQAAIFPHGRSLERSITDFNHPRTVLTWQSTASSTPYLLYMAYTPNAQELEVISWNWNARQFDFKLVQDYAPGKTPKIVNAPRALCVACHRGGGPIFLQAAWDETTENGGIASQLKHQARDSLSRYFLDMSPLNFGRSQLSSPDVDFQVRLANPMLQNQQMCKNACGGNLECRKGMLLAALLQTASVNQAVHLPTSRRDSMDQAIRLAWPDDGFKVVSDLILNRTVPADPLRFDATEDPLRSRPFNEFTNYMSPSQGTDTDSPVRYARCWNFTSDQRSALQSWNLSELDAAMDSEQMTALVKTWLPSEGAILAALSNAITAPQPIRSATTVAWNAPLAPPQVVSDPHRAKQSTLALFHRYCADCHGGPTTRPPVLPLGDLHRLNLYVATQSADRTVRELMSPALPLMPPLGAPQPSLEERLQMLSDLR